MAESGEDRRTRSLRAGAGRALAGPAKACARAAHWALRATMALTLVAALGLLVLWLRLSQGPVEMVWAADLLLDRVNRATDAVTLEARALELSAGEGAPAGLALTGLTVKGATGAPLLSVPRIGATLDPAALLEGKLRPREIRIHDAAVRIVRERDGRVRFALTDDTAAAPPAERESAPDLRRRMDAVTEIVDSLVGDAPAIPALGELTRVQIADARIVYDNAATGRRWQSDQADLMLERTGSGAALRVDVGFQRAGGAAGPALTLRAERERGVDRTRITVEIDGLRPVQVASEVPQLDWLRLVDAPLEGRLGATLTGDGRLTALSGALVAADGSIGEGANAVPLERFALDFSYEPDGRRMRIATLELAAPAADLDVSGFADLTLDRDDRPTALAAQVDVRALRVHLPDVFENEERFDDGQIVARVDFEDRSVEVAEARLRQGPLSIEVSGAARLLPAGWTTDLRIHARDVAVERLIGLWPLPAADGARRWLAKHLIEGRVDEALAELRLTEGEEPQLSLDFNFRDAATTYLKEMTPVRGIVGEGHMSWERLDLAFSAGSVEPVAGRPIDLAGSELSILDLHAKPAPAEIRIRGRGPTASVLALIDEEPLGFVSKLDLDPRIVRGAAEVETLITLPLDADLKLNDVEAETTAVLRDVAMPFSLKVTGEMDIRANRLELEANTRQMRLRGPITAEGAAVRLDWEERYGGASKGRDIRVAGRVTPDELRRVNINIPGFDAGTGDAVLTVSQVSKGETRLAVEADLTDAVVSVEPVFWSKPRGLKASVSGEGVAESGLTLERLALSGPGLEARGSLALGPDGAIRRADITRLDMGELADLRAEVVAEAEGFVLDVRGRWFDLAFLDRARDPVEPPYTPIRASYAVDQVRVSPQVRLGGVRGSFSRKPSGEIEARMTGQVAGVAPVEATYRKSADAPGLARITAADAGRVLEAAKLFEGARGGRLEVETLIAPDRATSLRGKATIRDVVVVQDAKSFNRVLTEGDLTKAAKEVQDSGIRFDRVDVPFAYRGPRIEFGTVLATSPSLAIKATGSVNEASQALSLRGVISPAYGLTGALNNIPLLGELLGGRGEGVLAMTFQVGGTTENPQISVNPLSLLAPGFLRNIFEGGAFTGVSPAPSAARTAARFGEAAERTKRPPDLTPEERAAADAEQAERLRRLLGE